MKMFVYVFHNTQNRGADYSALLFCAKFSILFSSIIALNLFIKGNLYLFSFIIMKMKTGGNLYEKRNRK